jgi:hypothetical protein
VRERERGRDRSYYEDIIAGQRADRDRSFRGQVVVRGKGNPWVLERQGLVRNYLMPSRYTGEPVDTALDGWIVFVQQVRQHSGRHQHQGGLVIYILEGEGHSIIDGERLDWEAGDLLLLPLKPGGVEHQHFNRYEDRPVKWIAFIHSAIYEWGASEMVQLEDHPDYKGPGRRARTRR